MRATVVKRVSFDAAHFLPDYPGKCSVMHGHHWVVELGVSGDIDPVTGMVIDFTTLNSFLEHEVVDRFDHSLVNDTVKNSTAENIATWILNSWYMWSEDLGIDVEVAFVRVWETPDSYAEIRCE